MVLQIHYQRKLAASVQIHSKTALKGSGDSVDYPGNSAVILNYNRISKVLNGEATPRTHLLRRHLTDNASAFEG
jgi:hypothetical protein